MLLLRHRADDTVSKAIARVLRAALVAVDDIGLLPVAQDLYRLVDGAYEKRSIAVSSNLHPPTSPYANVRARLEHVVPVGLANLPTQRGPA